MIRVTSNITCRSCCASTARRMRGFSFTELLFAVMILGIGFILVAAIFPVGLAQTKSNFDETHAASLARAAAAEVGKVAREAVFSSTDLVPLQTLNNNTAVTSQIAHANMISASDPRYAWVALYRKMGATSKTAQLCVFVVNRSDPFTPNDFFVNNRVRRLEPRRVEFDIIDNQVTLRAPPSPQGDETANVDAAAPSAFLLVANDNLGLNSDISDTGDRAAANGRLVGRVYRLGAAVGTANRFHMFPGTDFTTETFQYDHDGNPGTPLRVVSIPSIRNGVGYLVGRDRTGTTTFEGGVMDVAYYTTLISLK